MKVAVLGIGQFNFLNNLYDYIGKYRNECEFYAIVGEKHKSLLNEKNDVIQFVNLGSRIRLKNYSFVFYQFFWKCLIVNFLTYGLSNVYNLIKLFAKENNIIANITNDYDVFHFHFITWQYILPAYFLPQNKKIIFSFWGSDLLRRTSYLNIFIVKELLKKAHKITVQSIELREIFLAKYGREFMDKVVVVKFIADKKIYESLDKQLALSINSNSDSNSKFKSLNNKINIVIGHNSKEENNHLKIVEQLVNIPSSELERLYLIFPFSYGRNNFQEQESYKNLIIELLSAHKIDFYFIEKYLTTEEIADLRLHTDIFIHLPITDALSGTLTEALYGGAKVITGSWLPYGPFRRGGLKYHEIPEFKVLPQKILEVMSDDEKIGPYNREEINRYFLHDSNFKKWLKLY